MRLNTDLTEAISLGHDLGTHAVRAYGRAYFERTFRLTGSSIMSKACAWLTFLKKGGGGLNLTYDVRDGIFKPRRHYDGKHV
ncbi:MAG: hypothetical protein L6V93_20310 [Clostridiales bacterium]|nr:MAG: hypothetical protein L6V93_20310 [Clostridiales bacterium]